MGHDTTTFFVRLASPFVLGLLLLLLLLLNQAYLLLESSGLSSLILLCWNCNCNLGLLLGFFSLELLLDCSCWKPETLKKLLLFLLKRSATITLLYFLTVSELLGLVISFTFLEYSCESLAHISEFEMRPSFRVRIFLPSIVVVVDALVVN